MRYILKIIIITCVILSVGGNSSMAVSQNISANSRSKAINLPSYAYKNAMIEFEGYYYFVQTGAKTNKIYRVCEKNMSKYELVYSYEWDTGYGGIGIPVRFYINNKSLWFVYHTGGCAMGADRYCKVGSNGKAKIQESGYLILEDTPKGTFKIDIWQGVRKNNLSLISNASQKQQRIGSSELGYGYIDTSYVSQNQLFVIGSSKTVFDKETKAKEDINKIYNINLSTNETVKIVDSSVDSFKIINNKIYYVKEANSKLYMCNIDGTNEIELSKNKLENYKPFYIAINSNVYYTTIDANNNRYLYKVENAKEDSLVLKERIGDINTVEGNIICRFSQGQKSGLKVLDGLGNLKLDIKDEVSNFYIGTSKVLIVVEKTKEVKAFGY